MALKSSTLQELEELERQAAEVGKEDNNPFSSFGDTEQKY